MSENKKQLWVKWENFFVLFLLAILGFFVYANSFKGVFLWDDEFLVQRNANIRKLSGIPELFTQDMGGMDYEDRYGFYRPLTMATYSVNYAAGESDIFIYRFTNVFLHIIAAFSAYFMIKAILRDNLIALCSGVLFILFPAHTVVVDYISARSEALSAIFIMSGVSLYVKYLELKDKRLYLLVLLNFAFALLSKENSLVFPGLLLLYHYAFKKSAKLKELLPVFTLALLYVFVRCAFLKVASPHTDITNYPVLFKRVPGFFAAIDQYLRILFFPFHLHYDYGNSLFRFYDYRVIIGFIMALSLIAVAFLRRNRSAVLFFCVGWFFIALLPVSSIYPINAFFMSEQWLYLPSVGFFIMIAQGISWAYGRQVCRKPAVYLFLCIALFYSYLTIRQNNYWTNAVLFYKRELEYSPKSIRLYYNLGNEYLRLGKYEEAIAISKKALEINLKDYKIYNNLATAYIYAGDYNQAIAIYKKAIEINRNNYLAYNNLAIAYCNLDNKHEAIEMLKKSLEIKPRFGIAHFYIAQLYLETKQYESAVKHYNKAVESGVHFPDSFLKQLGPYIKQ